MTNQTSYVLWALVGFLSIGCQKVAVEVGEGADAGPDSPIAAGGNDGTAGKGAGGASSSESSSFDPGPLSGGGGAGGAQSSSSGWTITTVMEAPSQEVDILFVVDNSPSMDPKQNALVQNFPRMIAALQSVPGGMPDVHIGVVSSDVGAGMGEAGGNCSGVLGNSGILWGNDPDADPDTDGNKLATVTKINNVAGAEGCGMKSGARWIEDVLNVDGVTRSRNYQGDLSDVFSCLATAVGVGGCGYEHTLQSLRVALNPAEGVNQQNLGFLRAKAGLAIVIVSDEDDCSADPNTDTNDGMFFHRTLGDTASLRCATRAHVCNGKAIPNYDPAMGYTSTLPFSANFADCEAKDDNSSSDPLNRDVKSLPLIRIRDVIDSVKQVKRWPEDEILVAGIIGWPENGNTSSVPYSIGKDTTSMPAEQQKLWDCIPICTQPDIRSADGNIYKAYGGLRLKKFIDGFGRNGQVYSICSPASFANALHQIGNTLAQRTKPGCFKTPLADVNPVLPETQPECSVQEMIPCNAGDCRYDGYQHTPLSQCIDPTTGSPLSPSQPATVNIPDDLRPCWHLAYDTTPTTGCAEAPLGQKIAILRKGGGLPPRGARLGLTCRTCDSPLDPRCSHH